METAHEMTEEDTQTTYICPCCGCKFNNFDLSLDIYAIDTNGKVAFIIDENALTNGRSWSDVFAILKKYCKEFLSNYGAFSNAAAEASMANPDDAALKHLATQHPITPICADFKLDLEYIS